MDHESQPRARPAFLIGAAVHAGVCGAGFAGVAASVFLRIAALALPLAVSGARLAAQSHFPADDSVPALVRSAVSLPSRVSVVVGMLDADGSRRVVAVGDTTLDGRSLFEIGSITKVFTGTLLAYAVENGEARLDQPLADLLPGSVRVPTRNGKQITLVNLATHTSGLPRMPDNIRPADLSNPYVDYTVAQMYEFLNRHTLEHDIGDESMYSNYGGGLLGHALARRAGMTWEQLARTRILAPLGMTNTMIAIPDSVRPRLVPGHDRFGKPTSNWDLAEAFAGSGSLRSGADDMLTFLAANIAAPESTTLGRAMRRATTRHPVGHARGGLHWGINENRFGNTTIGHGGGTAGYSTWVGFDPARRIGVVVLSNASGIANPARIGGHLLDPRTPLSTASIASGFTIMGIALAALFVLGVAVAWRRTGAGWRRFSVVTVVTAIGAAIWLGLTWTAGRLRLLNDPDPPTLIMAFVIMTAIVLTLGATRVGAKLARGLPLWVLVGFHVFRLPLELLMHRAYEAGLMPREMSYMGWNFDILSGIAALVLAIMLARGTASVRAVRWFNGVGALLLLNIIVISILATPGPLHVLRTSPANTWITGAPYVWLPMVMVAMAIFGHIVLFRRLRRGEAAAAPGGAGSAIKFTPNGRTIRVTATELRDRVRIQ